MTETTRTPEASSRPRDVVRLTVTSTVAFVVSLLLAWPAADGATVMRLAVAFVAVVGVFWRRPVQVVGLVGLAAGCLLGGSASWSTAVLIAFSCVEVFVIDRILRGPVFVLDERAPAQRVMLFLGQVAVLSVAGGVLEHIAMGLVGDDVPSSPAARAIGLGIASCIAAAITSRRLRNWFRYDRTLDSDLLGPLIVVVITLVAIEITRQIWQHGDENPRLSTVALVFLVEALAGLAVLAVLLQGANAQFQMARERRQRESLLEAALDATPGVSLVFDSSHQVRTGNRVVRETMATKTSAPSVLEVLNIDEGSMAGRMVAEALERSLNGEPAYAEIPDDSGDGHVDGRSGGHVDGTMRIVEVETYPVLSSTDDRLGFLHMSDTTERRARAMRTAQAERMESLGALAGGLAHDFNNLLFVTLGNLQLMSADETVAGNERLTKFVTRSISAVERGAEITKSLLAVARSQPLEEKAVALGDLVKGVLPLVRQAMGEGRVVETDIADPAIELMVDAGRLSSCILNLAFNARDAMGPTGRIVIAAHRRDEMLDLSVSDDGSGMPPEVVARAFEPFFTTKRAGSGTGLGLATVYAFARQSGGTARLESRVGVGTKVTLSLPVHVPGETQPLASTSRRNARRVVVADDEQSLAELVASWLIDLGVDARFATSPKAALELIEDFEPDILVSDANFGEEMDGLELARLASAIVPELVVVFMTGYSSSMRALQEQGEHTLAKPFSRDDLFAALSSYLATAEVHDE